LTSDPGTAKKKFREVDAIKSTSTLLDVGNKTSGFFNAKRETEIVAAAYSINNEDTTIFQNKPVRITKLNSSFFKTQHENSEVFTHDKNMQQKSNEKFKAQRRSQHIDLSTS
jgi:hypothetical protein